MMKIELGDFVENRYGEKGSIMEQYDNFYDLPFTTMKPQDWLDAQLIPFTEDQLYEKWFSVHCQSGGSIWSPESLLKLIKRPQLP